MNDIQRNIYTRSPQETSFKAKKKDGMQSVLLSTGAEKFRRSLHLDSNHYSTPHDARL